MYLLYHDHVTKNLFMSFVNIMNKILKLRQFLFGIMAGSLMLSCFNKSELKETKSEDISQKNVLVLDDFIEKDIDINDDDTCDVTHGELVSKIIEAGLPEYNVDKIDAHIRCFRDSDYKQELFEKIMNGKKRYEAANISIGPNISYKELSERTGIDVNRENLASKAKEIKTYLKSHPDDYLMNGNIFMDAKMGGIADILDILDSLSAKGTKLYVSTSNSGPHYLNLISLADGAVVVGAVDSTGIKDYTSVNSLVKRFCDDAVKISKTNDGYSIDGGKTTAFRNLEVTKGSNNPYPHIHEGTSFATPRVLTMDLK